MSAKLAVLLFCIGLSGCVSIPPTRSTEGIRSEALASHVNFLAQSALKGRKPETRGSRIARSYIIDRFKAYGLVPWEQERGYVQSFGYGNNIIGVLRGSDADLSSEVVLVCAHYDHVGKDHGKICPGAADNASGVAALLETAKQMSLFEHRPKRTVVFAAFDAEEMNLLGSFAFACRPDVEKARVVAVLNVDILGRDFMDVVDNTLFVTGTEEYPALREQIFRSGTNASVDVRPIGTDLIGPRGDHAAFELRPIPCMFFSSGMYGDYHKPTDTPDKLNYAAMERSTRVVFETVRELANCAEIRRTPLANGCDPEELRTVAKVMSELSGKSVGIKKEDAERFKKLAAETTRLSESGEYNPGTRAKLIAEASGTLAPYFLSLGGSETPEQQKQMSVVLPFLQQLYLDHKSDVLQGYRQLVLHVLKYRPSLIRNMPKFSYEIFKIADGDIALSDRGAGQYSLNAMITRASVSAKKGWLGFRGGFGIYIDGINGEGTKEQLIDLCLLRLRRERSNELHVAEITKVLHAVTETNAKDLWAQRLKPEAAETEWLVKCMRSDCPELAQAAISSAAEVKDASIRSAAYKLMADRDVRSDVRAAAIELVGGWKDKNALLELCGGLDDNTVAYQREYVAELSPGYPFADRAWVKASMLPMYEEMWKQANPVPKTIGDLAAAQLKAATKKDFGKDRLAWQKWVRAHVRQAAASPLKN